MTEITAKGPPRNWQVVRAERLARQEKVSPVTREKGTPVVEKRGHRWSKKGSQTATRSFFISSFRGSIFKKDLPHLAKFGSGGGASVLVALVLSVKAKMEGPEFPVPWDWFRSAGIARRTARRQLRRLAADGMVGFIPGQGRGKRSIIRVLAPFWAADEKENSDGADETDEQRD